ncbi:hypothetical protein [Pseudohongiella spirulinae]|uniref:Uncharacterized protein n=1 Tax=Pseudohongiella spirulinae TaxID=1249552 RepID=A0A0S2KC16_9GAMM|nr:hypothetical protein [Pseudohongiella spirulinae]ALO45753.1 hypothetical protein PS2015_1091 [Pseudohongiella spirulinae]
MEYEFESLNPAEVAILWLASDLTRDDKEKPTILASNATLILMTVLAQGFAKLNNPRLAERALSEISTYSKDLVQHIAERGSYVRYDLPVRKLLEKLDDIGFPLVIDEPNVGKEGKKRSKVSIAYEQASEMYENTLRELEEKELLIDPPWYKNSLAAGSLIVLLGSVPLEINIKTEKGQQVVTSAEAKFWSYENVVDGDSENTHINIKLAKFIDKAVENLGSGFVDAWKEQNPDRTESLEIESERVSHNKQNQPDA